MVRIIEFRSLEEEILEPLAAHIRSVGFEDRFAQHFKTDPIAGGTPKIRISTASPFAVLLFQQAVSPNSRPDISSLFPSITVMDSYGSETEEELGRAYEDGVASASQIQEWASSRRVLVSNEQIQTLGSSQVPYKKWSIRSMRTLNFDIWGENHDLVSRLYDMVESFAVVTTDTDESFVLHGSITGKRSGDVNVEFGTVLYGAMVSVPLIVSRDVLELDSEIPYPISVEVTHRNFGECP